MYYRTYREVLVKDWLIVGTFASRHFHVCSDTSSLLWLVVIIAEVSGRNNHLTSLFIGGTNRAGIAVS